MSVYVLVVYDSMNQTVGGVNMFRRMIVISVMFATKIKYAMCRKILNCTHSKYELIPHTNDFFCRCTCCGKEFIYIGQ